MNGEGSVPHVKMVRDLKTLSSLLLFFILFSIFFAWQIRIAALNAASAAADESQDPQRTHKGRTKEAQVRTERLLHTTFFSTGSKRMPDCLSAYRKLRRLLYITKR